MKLKQKKGLITDVVDNLGAGAIGLLILAGILVASTAFGNTQLQCPASYVLNGTTNCYLSTNVSLVRDFVYTPAANLTGGVNGMANAFGSQLPTVGTMFGVALILGAIGLIGYGIAVGAKKFNE